MSASPTSSPSGRGRGGRGPSASEEFSQHAPLVEQHDRQPLGAGVEALRPRGEVAQLALLARLKGMGEEAGDAPQSRLPMKGSKAADLVMWALEVNQRGPTGTDDRPPPVRVNRLARRACAGFVGLFVWVAVLALVRGYYRELAAENDMLLASGTPAYSGEEPVASLAAALRRYSLVDCAKLSAVDLQGARDVSLVHRGMWYSWRVVHVQKFSDSHLWMQASDGTGVRVRSGKVYFRQGILGDEVLLAADDAASPEAAAYFEEVAPSSRAT